MSKLKGGHVSTTREQGTKPPFNSQVCPPKLWDLVQIALDCSNEVPKEIWTNPRQINVFMRANAVDLITQIKCHLESLTPIETSILHMRQPAVASDKNSIVSLPQYHQQTVRVPQSLYRKNRASRFYSIIQKLLIGLGFSFSFSDSQNTDEWLRPILKVGLWKKSPSSNTQVHLCNK